MSDPKGRIYAIGDCAHIQSQPLPCTAQAAERQGRYLAHALSLSSQDNPETKPFVFKPLGMLAYVGGYRAIHDLPVDKSQGRHARSICRVSLGGIPLLLLIYDSTPFAGLALGVYPYCSLSN